MGADCQHSIYQCTSCGQLRYYGRGIPDAPKEKKLIYCLAESSNKQHKFKKLGGFNPDYIPVRPMQKVTSRRDERRISLDRVSLGLPPLAEDHKDLQRFKVESTGRILDANQVQRIRSIGKKARVN
jgi:hypothetical protein